MMTREYSKDNTTVSQKLTAFIHADKKTVFHYLATTDGISTWFPQLSLTEEEDEQLVLFDMGDGTFEKMKLLDYKTNEHISYEWASGKIEFTLEEVDDGTQLVLSEELPLDFNAIPEDFTGWYVQMNNVKSVAETGASAPINRENIKEVKTDIIEQLDL